MSSNERLPRFMLCHEETRPTSRSVPAVSLLQHFYELRSHSKATRKTDDAYRPCRELPLPPGSRCCGVFVMKANSRFSAKSCFSHLRMLPPFLCLEDSWEILQQQIFLLGEAYRAAPDSSLRHFLGIVSGTFRLSRKLCKSAILDARRRLVLWKNK